VEYRVEDDGLGFNPDYADKLFGAFQQLEVGAEVEGTGICLAIARRIAVQHGGRIRAGTGRSSSGGLLDEARRPVAVPGARPGRLKVETQSDNLLPMRVARISRALLPLLLALIFAAVLPAAAGGIPAVGDKAPSFSLPSQEGGPVSLEQSRGKWVVLYFYPKDMTPGCTIEAHNFQRDLEKYQKVNAVILGVSVDSVDSHKEFCAKESLAFKLLADADRKVTASYGSLSSMMGKEMASRNTFLIDPSGVIRKVYEKVSPSGHSEEVLAELARLQASKSGGKPALPAPRGEV
jgi:peroxiredoxin Q/BCP